MNRIARALTALIVAAGLTTAVAVTTQADASSGSVVRATTLVLLSAAIAVERTVRYQLRLTDDGAAMRLLAHPQPGRSCSTAVGLTSSVAARPPIPAVCRVRARVGQLRDPRPTPVRMRTACLNRRAAPYTSPAAAAAWPWSARASAASSGASCGRLSKTSQRSRVCLRRRLPTMKAASASARSLRSRSICPALGAAPSARPQRRGWPPPASSSGRVELQLHDAKLRTQACQVAAVGTLRRAAPRPCDASATAPSTAPASMLHHRGIPVGRSTTSRGARLLRHAASPRDRAATA